MTGGRRPSFRDAARPIFLRRGPIGVVVVHGITSTPGSVADMARYLAGSGMTVLAPCLAGHGTRWQDLERTRWQDWYASVEEAYRRLRTCCRTVWGAGLSMGGTQVLHLAAHHPELGGVIALAPSIFMKDWRIRFLPLILALHLKRTGHGVGGSIADPSAPREPCYDRLPLRSACELVHLQAHLRDELHLIRCPALFVQGRHDPVVPPGNAAFGYARVASRRKRLVSMDRPSHVMTMDYDHERLFRMAAEFIRVRA